MQGSTTQPLESQIFGLLFEHGSEAVFTVQRDTGQVLAANGRMAEMVCRSVESLIGTSVYDLVHLERTPKNDLRVGASMIFSRPGLHEEIAFRRLDDYPAYCSLTVAHISHPRHGELAACIARDTTERRNLERQLISKHAALNQAHVELEQAFRELRDTQDRLEMRNRELTVLGAHLATAAHRAAIGEFSAGIAHTLNNPLGAIVSSMRQLEKRLGAAGKDEAVSRVFERTRIAVSRMEEIVDAVRRAHRSGNLDNRARSLSLAGEVALIVSLFEGRLEGVEIECEVDPALEVFAPADPLHHVGSNVVDNAVREVAARGGGIKVSGYREGDSAVISVFNSGHGVSADIEPRLFEPFVSGRAEGAGLGLCMARRLARQWGGDVIYVPAADGARFDILVPLGGDA